MSFEVARLSASGRGAVSLVGLEGAECVDALRVAFRPRAASGKPRSSEWYRSRTGGVHGDVVSAEGEVLDDGLLLPVGPDAFWLGLHGNPIVIDAVVARLVELGGVVAEGPRGFVDDEVESIEAEVLTHLPSARSEAIAAFLLRQGDCDAGGLAGWRRRILERGAAAAEDWREVERASRRGFALMAPPRVVLTGVPNAGKSSLFNRLLGRERMVTSTEPGTTRDVIEEAGWLGAFPVTWVDGAGVRATDEAIERAGIERILAEIEGAALVVELIPPEGEAPLSSSVRAGQLSLQIRSRADQIAPAADGGARADDGALRVSSLTGEGLAQLEGRMAELLFGVDPSWDPATAGPTPFSARQRALIQRIGQALECGDDPRAIAERL